MCHSWGALGLVTCVVKWPSYLRVFVCVFCFCCEAAYVCAPFLLPAHPSANMMVYRILGGGANQ